MARRRGMAKFKVAEMTSTGLAVQKAVEKSVLFGSPDDRKTIIILAGVLFVIAGFVYWLIARQEGGASVPAILFASVNGGLLGMLVGQLAKVYPDRVVIIFTLLGAFLGEMIFLVAAGKLEDFTFNRNTFLGMLAVFFWAGWVGFWVGFVMYTKRTRARLRFQQRLEERLEEDGGLPPDM